MAESQRGRPRGGSPRIASLTLSIVGSSPAIPRPGGASSSYLVRTPNAAVLLDIGIGSVGKLQLATEYQRLDAVVISHMHADHFFDLAPLRYACKYGEPRPKKPIAVWLPPRGRVGLESLRKAVSIDATPDFFDSVFAVGEYDPCAALAIGDIRLSFGRTRHYVEAYAIRVQHNGATLTYSSDTAPCDAVIELARGSSLFLCEAALGLDTETGERGHSSAQEAGSMAKSAGVERLVLTHYPAWYSTSALVEAAQSRFEGNVEAAADGANYAI